MLSLRGVYSIIGMTVGNVCGEPAQLHLTSVLVMPQIGKQGDGVHTRRRVHGVLVLTMMGVS